MSARFTLLDWFDTKAILFVFLTTFVFIWLFLRNRQPTGKLPPGPTSWPLIGSIPGILTDYLRLGRPDPHQFLGDIAKNYGKFYGFKVGTQLVVVANDYNTIKDAGGNHLTAARPKQIKDTIEGGEGIALCSGESWLQQRRFTLSTMRSFGVGKMSFEQQIAEETDYLLKEFQQHNGKPFNPKFPILNAASNILCSVMFGKRYEYSDDEFKHILATIDHLTKAVGSGGSVMYNSVLRFFLKGKDESLMANFVNFLKTVVTDHRKLYDSQNLQDYIDVYLREMELSREVTAELSEPNLVATLAHLFFAGTDTSANTIRWALLYMMEHPQVQRKVQEEIDSVVGRNRLPKLTDRPSLPYTDAVIHEVSRMCTVLPLSVPHCASDDTIIRGFDIPKDTMIVLNLWAAHNDPDMWEEPKQFRPERFLDDKGALQKTEFVISFSMGRRQCIGEHLAKKEVFILFTHLMHRFAFTKANKEDLNFKGIFGITNSPVPFELCAVVRDQA